jgi:hypothetical protein
LYAKGSSCRRVLFGKEENEKVLEDYKKVLV